MIFGSRLKQSICFIIITALFFPGVFAGCANDGKTGKDQKTAITDTSNKQGTTDGKEPAKPKNNYPTQQLVDVNGKRVTNFFGIHTLIYPADDMKMHMGWAQHLVGEGGYVKERFEPVTKDTKGAASQWVQFLKECYDRNLVPIVKIGGIYENDFTYKPEATAPGDYSELAAAIKRVVEQLPLKKGVPLYIELFNEPNLKREWSNEMPDPREYGEMLVDVADALHSIGDPRIRVMNGALSPGGNYNNLRYVEAMVKNVPDSLWAFDVWACHPYPSNHPPEYNLHDGTATNGELVIDSYLRELKIFEKYGRKDVKVIATETGYELGDSKFSNSPYASEKFSEITEELRAEYMVRAFREFWSKWPEVIAVCPFEMSGVQPKNWQNFDWVYIDSSADDKGYPTSPTPQYEAVSKMEKPPYVLDPALEKTEDKNMDVGGNSRNIALTAIASCSTSMENWGWSIQKINNGFTVDSDLGWTSAGEEQEEWVIYEFKEIKEFSKAVLVPRSDAPETGKYFPQSFDIQVSDDGTSWKTIFSFEHKGADVFNPGTQPQAYTFDTAEGKFVKLLIKKKTNHGNGGYHAQLSEFELY